MGLQNYIGFILIFVHAVTGTITISLQGMDISELRDTEAVNVVEGNRYIFTCNSDTRNENTTFSWQRNGAITVNETFEIKRIRLEDAGTYICRTTHKDITENKTVFANVMYPPSYPVIEGSNTGLYGEQVTLKCISDAKPEPSFTWRRGSRDGHLLSRNQTYQLTIPYEDYGIVCIVQSLMVTTFGTPRYNIIEQRTSILSNVMAYIKNKNDGLHWRVNEGEVVDIYCSTEGKPSPKVWWTKVGHGSFKLYSPYLKDLEVGKEFAGEYVWHAENTVTTVNGTAITAHDTKTVRIEVIETTVTENNDCTHEQCLAVCKQSPATTDTTPYESGDEINKRVTANDSNKTERVLFIVAGIGWTALIFSVVTNVWLLRLRKKQNEKHSEYMYIQGNSAVQRVDQLQANLSTERPSYISDVRIGENSYMDFSIYNQINSDNGEESNGTVASTRTYLQPTVR